jgi:glutamate dehydrogenase
MSDTTEAAVEKLRQETAELEAVSREVERLVGEDEAPLATRFAELFFSKAPPGFLSERSAASLARMVLENFRFLQRSRPDRVDVELANPDVDTEGWFAPVTVVRTNLSERPFIVDSIREYLHAEGLSIEVYIYPVLQVGRDASGNVVSLKPSREGGTRESHVYCEVSRVSDPESLSTLRDELELRLKDVVKVTDDFEPMRHELDATIVGLEGAATELPDRRDEVTEIQAFLEWLRDGGFVFLGFREYDVVDADGEPAVAVRRGSGLGLLRDEEGSAFREPVPVRELPEGQRALVEGGPILIISKTNATSTVHRRARMDYIGVKRLDERGEVVGERRFIGLFTSVAYSEKADRIPILRRKLDRILEDSGVAEGSHDYKEIHTIFNTLPKEELFLTSTEEIGADVRTVLTTFDSDEVRVSLRRDPLQRGASVMVILAKERFSGEVRKRIEESLVEAFNGEVLNYHLALGEGDQARLHFYIAAPADRLESVTPQQLETRVRALTRTWSDRLHAALERRRTPEDARRLVQFFGETLSAEYQAATAPAVAVHDILELDTMVSDGREVAILLRNPEAAPGVAEGEEVTELKLVLRVTRLVLSDFMPILENCGLRVISVTPFELRGADGTEAYLYSFLVQRPDHTPIPIDEAGKRLGDTILAVRAGDCTSSPLNALVTLAGLTWREVDVLRTYASFAFQSGAVPSRLSLPVALQKHPDIASLLFDLFRVRFDPDAAPDAEERRRAEARVLARFLEALKEVTQLSEDRALRRLQGLIQATLRTNFYRTGGAEPRVRSGGVPYISLKFDATRLEGGERNRLRYEVWVRSSRMEGIHLRGAKVARGGIRWSDRPDDFRTEVLGLVKTQMVKNAVIVPAGSKGGFVTLCSLPAEEMADEAREQYKTLIRGLLDLTDNLVGGETVPPEGVVCWDDPDPYLVVAADKGTAKFSDVANGVAEEYGFWLGDAFASGGSNGYDHKEVGITAGGAWECVKRHFLEMGKDIQAEPFTVVGIGDMSGDVFGNGMLLSPQIRLLAAFDHRDIFLDPDPDPATSFAERQRLFELGRSSWQDYDAKLLSEGGVIVPRGSKEIRIPEPVREALGIDSEGPFDGETLIRHILAAPAELLWNGGIGTYVKASTETHSEAGDPANDAVRIDATALRCQVVGEGGNLGFTQRARIEYALQGGRINTDAIDNSGGVDLSDREVNLKILLRLASDAGVLDPDDRNDLLRDLQSEVADLVLRDNENQGLAISLDEVRAREGLDDLRDLMAGLERAGVLDRSAEQLPTWEVLAERQEEGQGFTRPELSILLAYAKLHLTSHLLGSSVPEDPAARRYLRDYFPARALAVVGEERLDQHRLHREIVASQLAGDLVNLMGAGFVHRVSRGVGRAPAEVARAWLVAAELTGQSRLLEELRLGRSPMPVAVTYRWLRGLSRVMERTTRWLLSNPEFALQGTEEAMEEHRSGLDRLRKAFPDLVTGEDRRTFETLAEELQADGADEDTSRGLVTLRFLDQLLEILRVHRSTGADPLDVARTFYRVSALFWIPWLRTTVFEAAGDDRWEQRAAQALSADLTRAHQLLAGTVLRLRAEAGSVEAAVEAVSDRNRAGIDHFNELLREVEAEEKPGLPALTVVVRDLTALAGTLGADKPTPSGRAE